MVLRCYQYSAVDATVGRVEDRHSHRDILPRGRVRPSPALRSSRFQSPFLNVDKLLFVVGCADLDYQTIREFNAFSEGSVDGTRSTKAQLPQMVGPSANRYHSLETQYRDQVLQPRSRYAHITRPTHRLRFRTMSPLSIYRHP